MAERGAPAAAPVLGPADLRQVVDRLGAEVTAAHPAGLVLVGVLKGAVPFLADLARRVRVPVLVDVVAVSSFAAGGGRARLVRDLDLDVAGRDVVVVDVLADTGLTLGYVLGTLRSRHPSSLSACVLLDRPGGRVVPVDLRFRGVEIGDELVVGYGLDYAGRYRNLGGIWAVDPAALQADPDAYVELLHPSGPASGPRRAR